MKFPWRETNYLFIAVLQVCEERPFLCSLRGVYCLYSKLIRFSIYYQGKLEIKNSPNKENGEAS